MIIRSSFKTILIACALTFACSIAWHSIAVGQTRQQTGREVFEDNYSQWKAYSRSISSSDFMRYLDCPYYRNIVALGPQAIPWIIERRAADKNDGMWWIGIAWHTIARIQPNPGIYPWADEKGTDWLKGGQKQANGRFESLYAKWKTANKQGNKQAAAKLEETMRALGIAALPKLVEKVKQGDDDLLPMVADLTRNTADISGETPGKRRAAVSAWWDKDKGRWLVPFPDQQKPMAGVKAESSATTKVATPGE